MKSYPPEFKERAVKLAVASEQPIAQRARDLGGNANTFHTGIGKDHRVERQEKQGNEAHLYEERQRLRQEPARLKEERGLFKKAAASFAQQLPCSTRGAESSTRRFPSGVSVGDWRSRGVATMSGSAGPPAPKLTPRSRWKRKSSNLLPRAVVPMAHAGSNPCWRRRACKAATVAWGASWPTRVWVAQPGGNSKRRRP